MLFHSFYYFKESQESQTQAFVESNLIIPKKLQKNLPYLLKPKDQIMKGIGNETQELVQQYTAVVMDPEESRIHHTVEMLKKIREEKLAKDKELTNKRHQKHAKELAEIEQRRKKKRMATTKSICRKLSKREMHRVKKAMDSIN